jgi:hypothetical protein
VTHKVVRKVLKSVVALAELTMQSDRRQTLQDVSNVPRRLTMGDNLGKVGRRPSIAVAPPTARKAHGAERASGNGSASQAQDPRNIHRNANVQRRLRQRIIDFASQNNFSEPLDDKVLAIFRTKRHTALARCSSFARFSVKNSVSYFYTPRTAFICRCTDEWSSKIRPLPL